MTDLKCFEPDQARYVLEELLGEGSNSRVYRALRTDLSGQTHQRVALKFLKDQTSVSFLRREFETLLQVRSNHCARVLAWETQNGESALAMEWIDGVTLYDLAKATMVSETQADEIARQIYLGLIDLRQAGLFHGDLQPRNVMIDRAGQVRLIDFASGRTASGFLQTTPAFAAPEVVSRGQLSFEADLFALGVIRQHLTTGFRHLGEPSSTKLKSNSLMQVEPSKRTFRLPADNDRARREISKEVAKRLSQQALISTQFLLPSAPPYAHPPPLSHSVFRTAIALALVLISAVTMPVMAEAPAESSALAATGSLVVTSEKWVRVELNGRDAGFAPLRIEHLRAGQHRVAWKTATLAGELRLTIAAGEVVSLRETRTGELKVR